MTFKEFIISRVQIFFCLVPLILMASVLLGSVYAPEQVFHYADLLAPIITAGFCVLPTCVTYFRKEPDVKQYLLRLAIQLALIVTEVMAGNFGMCHLRAGHADVLAAKSPPVPQADTAAQRMAARNDTGHDINNKAVFRS